jgi:hypothetical protein
VVERDGVVVTGSLRETTTPARRVRLSPGPPPNRATAIQLPHDSADAPPETVLPVAQPVRPASDTKRPRNGQPHALRHDQKRRAVDHDTTAAIRPKARPSARKVTIIETASAAVTRSPAL